ncbi:MAG: helix-turn-helix domain-containing protein [Acidobacteriota bacterium]|nr:helix-turn-helix domain-containing protein [Acidobacteriota bacterium]
MNDEAASINAKARDEFLTARQLAVILQVSESTVRRLARQGKIPAVRITTRITRFHLRAVRAALDGTRPRRAPANDSPDESPQLSFDNFSK